MSQSNRTPAEKLEELRRRLINSQEVVVTPEGQLLTPEERRADEATIKGKQADKTVLKPQRWF